MDDVTKIIDDFRRVCKKVQPDLNAPRWVYHSNLQEKFF